MGCREARMQKHTPVALRLKLLLDGREVVHQMVALVVLQRERILRLAAAHLAASQSSLPLEPHHHRIRPASIVSYRMRSKKGQFR